jgi:hypothetical protein
MASTARYDPGGAAQHVFMRPADGWPALARARSLADGVRSVGFGTTFLRHRSSVRASQTWLVLRPGACSPGGRVHARVAGTAEGGAGERVCALLELVELLVRAVQIVLC